MDVLKKIADLLIEILDIEGREIKPETYLVRELGAESIDLLELAVALDAQFQIQVTEDDIFLKDLRLYAAEAGQQAKAVPQYLVEKYPFLTESRAEEIMADLEEGGALKVKDLISYVVWRREQG
ncbi:MAG: phosphopantetheine-binding protein [Thermodesulfobacteriota bacterium]|nr:phosphopantetheine-binding protein [Thermodesulfobacteriota bacterium]